MAWQALLFMANVGGYSRSIGLLELNCKSIDTIMYICPGKAIMLQYVLHWLQSNRGTGTALLEAQILQKLSIIHKEVMYEIFLHIHEAYDAMYREQCLDILEGCGVGIRTP